MSKLLLFGDNSNIWKLDKTIGGKYKLISFIFTNNIFNVNDTNNQVYFTDSTTSRVGTLTNGYYDFTDIQSNLQTAMNDASTDTFTVSGDTKTNKLTITSASNFRFTFGTNTTNTSRKLLGFTATDGSNNTTQTSNICVDLNPYKQIFINVIQNDNRDIDGINYFNTSLIINGIGNFGDIVRYVPNDNFDQYVQFNRGTKQLEIKIHDSNNNNVNLNSEYSILFQKI